MKKSINILLAGIAILSVIFISSCKKETKQSENNAIFGTWIRTGVEGSYETITFSETDSKIIITRYDASAGLYTQSSGTFQTNNNNLSVNIQQSGESDRLNGPYEDIAIAGTFFADATYSIQNNILTINYTDQAASRQTAQYGRSN